MSKRIESITLGCLDCPKNTEYTGEPEATQEIQDQAVDADVPFTSVVIPGKISFEALRQRVTGISKNNGIIPPIPLPPKPCEEQTDTYCPNSVEIDTINSDVQERWKWYQEEG